MQAKAMVLMVAAAMGAVGCAGGVRHQARPLPEVPASVLERGSTIYFGSTFRAGAVDGADPLFVYERRVETAGDHVVATHITRSLSGALQIVDDAVHSPDYLLSRYTLHADQQGRTGSIEVTDAEVRFRLATADGVRTAREPKRDPVVVGPTLVGFMFSRLDALQAGQMLPIRFAVLERLETLGFELRSVEAPKGQLKVKMSASSPLVALLVSPVFFTFDQATARLVRIEGRVPPKVLENERWYDLDARVEYRFVADAYR